MRFVRGHRRLMLVSNQPIARNAEITFDYNWNGGDNGKFPLTCRCGAHDCRGALGQPCALTSNEATKYGMTLPGHMPAVESEYEGETSDSKNEDDPPFGGVGSLR